LGQEWWIDRRLKRESNSGSDESFGFGEDPEAKRNVVGEA
jgi:hypothetical protein